MLMLSLLVLSSCPCVCGVGVVYSCLQLQLQLRLCLWVVCSDGDFSKGQLRLAVWLEAGGYRSPLLC